MRFEVDGVKYRIEFEHWNPQIISEDIAPGTDCYIYQEGVDAPVCCGGARLYATNVFCKEAGRKYTLTRAIAHKDREFRKAAWGAYNGRKAKAQPTRYE